MMFLFTGKVVVKGWTSFPGCTYINKMFLSTGKVGAAAGIVSHAV
jgi:hypothetical protein